MVVGAIWREEREKREREKRGKRERRDRRDREKREEKERERGSSFTAPPSLMSVAYGLYVD